MWPLRRCKHPKRRRIWRTRWEDHLRDYSGCVTSTIRIVPGHICICPDCGKTWWEREDG